MPAPARSAITDISKLVTRPSFYWVGPCIGVCAEMITSLAFADAQLSVCECISSCFRVT